MLASVLMGLVAGARSMTPLAAVAWLARCGSLPNDGALARLLLQDAVVAGTTALAAGEILGDKMRSAPDRIVLPGTLARLATGAIAGAALAPREHQQAAALLGAAAAFGSAYLTFDRRMRAMRCHGQTSTGIAEDAATLASALLIALAARRR